MDKRATTEESLLLPEDILQEILVRIPLKLLARFRCVSKSWLSLIDSKGFIKSHNQHWAHAHHRVLIVLSDSASIPKQYIYKQCSQRALLSATDLSPLCHPISTNLLNNLWCCCNGVLCFYEGGRFVLLNPTTGVSKELPKDPEIDNRYFLKVKIGLGWDESCCAYKVFVGWMRTKPNLPSTFPDKSRVYSSKTNSWKTIEDPYLRKSWFHVGEFVGGKLHWLIREKNKNSDKISSFDVKTEEFGTIELPGEIETEGMFNRSLGVVGDCLCFSAKYEEDPGFHVWVMKESWEKLPTFHLHNHRFYSQVIGEVENGGILIYHASSFIVYCPRNGAILHQTDIGCAYTAHLYVESLVSPFLH